MGRRSQGFVKIDQGSRRRCGWKSREEEDIDAMSTAMEDEPLYVPPQINHFDESRSCMNLFVIHEHHTMVKPKNTCLLMQQITRLNCGSNRQYLRDQDLASVASSYQPAPTFPDKQSQLRPAKGAGSSIAAKIAIMATTIISSINVNRLPKLPRQRTPRFTLSTSVLCCDVSHSTALETGDLENHYVFLFAARKADLLVAVRTRKNR